MLTMSTPSDVTLVSRTTAQFESTEREDEFRREVFDSHRRRAIPAVAFVAALGAALIYRDFVSSSSEAILGTLSFRGPLLLFYLGVLTLLLRLESTRSMDALLLLWALVTVGATIYLHASRSVLSPSHHALDVALILIVSVAVPNRFLFQALPAVALAVASLLHVWLRESTDFDNAIGLWSAYIVSTLVGVMAAWQINVSERQLFRAHREIQTLHGIVPICASCKAIRDESGEWHRMEAYITRHTEAQFSHGLCPTCLAKAEAELNG